MKNQFHERRRRLFFGTFGGYRVQGLKDLSEIQDVGWLVWSWPKADPVHDFWISGTTFYRVRAGVFKIIEGLNPAERDAVLEAIFAWEKELRLEVNSQPPNESPTKQAWGTT